MGETEDPKNDSATKVEKDQKHERKEKDKHNDEEKENGEKDKIDEKKKDKDRIDGAKDKKKDKNPENKKDPSKLRVKLEKIEQKMQDMQLKKVEILKMINEVESNAPPATA